MPGFIAQADIDIDAAPDKVWETITTHASHVTFGAKVDSAWRVGSPVRWIGVWEDKAFEDIGEVLDAVAPYRLVLAHTGSGGGTHRLTYELAGSGGGTRLELTQDGNPTAGAAGEASTRWSEHLAAIKAFAERA